MDTLVQLSGFGDTMYSAIFFPSFSSLPSSCSFTSSAISWWRAGAGSAVKTFSIGFGPEIVGFNDRHGTGGGCHGFRLAVT